jgi:hypothetical protein
MNNTIYAGGRWQVAGGSFIGIGGKSDSYFSALEPNIRLRFST